MFFLKTSDFLRSVTIIGQKCQLIFKMLSSNWVRSHRYQGSVGFLRLMISCESGKTQDRA